MRTTRNRIGELCGKVAVVTGAASGQGRATARRLAAAGASIAALDVDAGGLATLAEELKLAGSDHLELAVDVSDPDGLTQAFGATETRLGPAYVLAAAAAIYPSPTPATELAPAAIARVFGVNALGSFHCAVEAARQMIAAREGGRIVLWSSVGARFAIAGHVPYCASKGAVESMTRALAVELGPYGILVNAIAPGAIDTAMIAGAELGLEVSVLPAGRIGQPEDIAELVAYLCSSGASFITGEVIMADGGLSALNGSVAVADRVRRGSAPGGVDG